VPIGTAVTGDGTRYIATSSPVYVVPANRLLPEPVSSGEEPTDLFEVA
jgi:hypothetical protein